MTQTSQKIRLAPTPPSHCSSALDSRTEPLGVPVGEGYCWCGCGHLAPVSDRTHRKYGWVRGKAKRYINGHVSVRHRPYIVNLDTGCWEWQARRHQRGYGLCERNGKGVLAHRLEYERVHGPVPEGLELDHLCRNTCCVNPDHLEPVTHAENMRRWAEAKNG